MDITSYPFYFTKFVFNKLTLTQNKKNEKNKKD